MTIVTFECLTIKLLRKYFVLNSLDTHILYKTQEFDSFDSNRKLYSFDGIRIKKYAAGTQI